MVEVGLQDMETYVSCRQNNVAQYIVTRTIIDLCLAAKRRPGPRGTMWCWEQEGLNLEMMQTASQETDRTEGGEETDGTEIATDD